MSTTYGTDRPRIGRPQLTEHLAAHHGLCTFNEGLGIYMSLGALQASHAKAHAQGRFGKDILDRPNMPHGEGDL